MHWCQHIQFTSNGQIGRWNLFIVKFITHILTIDRPDSLTFNRPSKTLSFRLQFVGTSGLAHRDASARLNQNSCWRPVCAPLVASWPMHSGTLCSMFGSAYFFLVLGFWRLNQLYRADEFRCCWLKEKMRNLINKFICCSIGHATSCHYKNRG